MTSSAEQQIINISIPPGEKLGVTIQQNELGQCIVSSKTDNPSSPLEINDTIISLNGNSLAELKHLKAWKQLFTLFGEGERKLVVHRSGGAPQLNNGTCYSQEVGAPQHLIAQSMQPSAAAASSTNDLKQPSITNNTKEIVPVVSDEVQNQMKDGARKMRWYCKPKLENKVQSTSSNQSSMIDITCNPTISLLARREFHPRSSDGNGYDFVSSSGHLYHAYDEHGAPVEMLNGYRRISNSTKPKNNIHLCCYLGMNTMTLKPMDSNRDAALKKVFESYDGERFFKEDGTGTYYDLSGPDCTEGHAINNDNGTTTYTWDNLNGDEKNCRHIGEEISYIFQRRKQMLTNYLSLNPPMPPTMASSNPTESITTNNSRDNQQQWQKEGTDEEENQTISELRAKPTAATDYDQEHNLDMTLTRLVTAQSFTYTGPMGIWKSGLEKCCNNKNAKSIELPGGKEVKLIRPLGSGCYGSVWLADLYPAGSSTPIRCALKVQWPSGSLHLEFTLQLALELKVIKDDYPFPRSLELHTFDGGNTQNGGSLLFMTAVNGWTVHDVVNSYQREVPKREVPIEVAVYLVHLMLIPLKMLHTMGKVVHFDVKSDNFMLIHVNGEWSVKLIDFGRAVKLPTLTEKFKGGVVAYSERSMMCKNMRLSKSFGVEQDYYGVALTAFMLLFMRHMKEKDTSIDEEEKMRLNYRISSRRQPDLWKEFFLLLFNFDSSKYDETVRSVSQLLEKYINGNKHNIEWKMNELHRLLSG